jgi:hypothetical protein
MLRHEKKVHQSEPHIDRERERERELAKEEAAAQVTHFVANKNQLGRV